jgi:hypothetical protein
MAKKRKYPSPENLSKQSLAGWIERVQSRISDQEYYLSRCKGQPSAVLDNAEQFLQHLQAKRRFLEIDLQAMRAGRNPSLLSTE